MADVTANVYDDVLTPGSEAASVTARLEAAAEAYHRFLGLAALDCLLGDDKLAALARDVAFAGQDACTGLEGTAGHGSSQYDWSALHRRPILDD